MGREADRWETLRRAFLDQKILAMSTKNIKFRYLIQSDDLFNNFIANAYSGR